MDDLTRSRVLLVEHPAIVVAVDCPCGGAHDRNDVIHGTGFSEIEQCGTGFNGSPPMCLVIVCSLCPDWHRFDDDGLRENCAIRGGRPRTPKQPARH